MHPSTYAHWSLSTARELTIEAARDASYARKTSTRVLPSGQLKKLLDSRSERDVLEGLRRVVTVRFARSLLPGHRGGCDMYLISQHRCPIDNRLLKHCHSSPT